MPPIQVVERREEPDLDKIWNLLREVDKKVDLHLQEESEYRPKLIELMALLERSKGALTLIKWTAAIVAASAAAGLWVTSHFTWKGF